MSLIKKECLAIREVVRRWKISNEDLYYLIESGQVTVSIRLFNTPIIIGTTHVNDIGHMEFKLVDRMFFNGIHDVHAESFYKLVYEKATALFELPGPDGKVHRIGPPVDRLPFNMEKLIVRMEEVERAETTLKLGPKNNVTKQFSQKNNFREVTLDGRVFYLGEFQANVIRILHDAVVAGDPWRFGQQVLAEAGSSSEKIVDLFKSQLTQAQQPPTNGVHEILPK